ncbi:MAG: NAD(+)/NADH kinase [Planctomycetes bacterium]|nr:NAD(+)/NADH kinase [Planctomycetota bacterium]
MRTVFVVAHTTRKPEITAILARLLPWLRKTAKVVGVARDHRGDLSKLKADLVITLGGDGTMLSVARRLKGNPVPVLGVNLGQLGFLAEVGIGDLKKVLPWILKGDYVLSPRMMLRTLVAPPGRRGKPKEYIALNDAVLLRLPKATMMTVGVSVSGEAVATYKGDGLIVATATGSTGYSLSAGGPILSERLKALILVPICPHTLANRPIVVSGNEVIEVVPETRSGSPVELVMDGQVSASLKSGTRVSIEKAPYQFNLVTVGRKGRYETIRDKLHWAGWVKEHRNR